MQRGVSHDPSPHSKGDEDSEFMLETSAREFVDFIRMEKKQPGQTFDHSTPSISSQGERELRILFHPQNNVRPFKIRQETVGIDPS